MCAKIVTVLNRKGGVGKTTLTIAIADTLISEHRADVTIVDLDPQATASQVLLAEIDFKARTENREIFRACLRLFSSRRNPTSTAIASTGLQKYWASPKTACAYTQTQMRSGTLRRRRLPKIMGSASTMHSQIFSSKRSMIATISSSIARPDSRSRPKQFLEHQTL